MHRTANKKTKERSNDQIYEKIDLETLADLYLQSKGANLKKINPTMLSKVIFCVEFKMKQLLK